MDELVFSRKEFLAKGIFVDDLEAMIGFGSFDCFGSVVEPENVGGFVERLDKFYGDLVLVFWVDPRVEF